MLNDVDLLQRLTKFAPYVFIVVGFVVAVSGQFVRSRLDDRVKVLQQQAETRRKLTPPVIDAHLFATEDQLHYVVVIVAENNIPFDAIWDVATTNDLLVSPLMLGKEELRPSDRERQFRYSIQLQHARIKDDYVELRLNWFSHYYAEMGKPDDLRGELKKRYKLVDGVPTPI